MNSFDVVVAGAGPSGMAAAASASASGCRVCLIDDNAAAGGQIWRGFEGTTTSEEAGAGSYARLKQSLLGSRVELRTGARVVAQLSSNVLRVESEIGCTDIGYQRLVLATGARERFLPFPGWTLPGVMGAGGLQAMVKSGLPVNDKRVVIAGSGPLLLAVADALTRHGARVFGIFEQAPVSRLIGFGAHLSAHPGKLWQGVQYRIATRSTPYRTRSWVTQAHGDGRLRAVTVSVNGSMRTIECDYLGYGFHLIPNLELPRLLGCEIESGYVRVDSTQKTTVEGVFAVGEPTGVGGLDKALYEGQIAGLACANRAATHLFAKRDRLIRFARALDYAFTPCPELSRLATPETLICRCEDVPRRALETKHNWREAKLHTRCGMGPCQGRICGPATEFLWGWDSERVRPPIIPARISTVAAATEGADSPLPEGPLSAHLQHES